MSNLTLAPEQIILDMIKAEPGQNAKAQNLTTSLITFGLPTAATGEGADRNTELGVTAAEGSGYTGDVVIRYNRLTFDQVVGNKDKDFLIGDATKIADLVDEINARYKINLTPADFVDGDLPTFTGDAGESHEFTLTANANSLIFIGSVTLLLRGEDVPLDTVITTTSMSGLTPPEDDAAATA